jgi:hypothetical protein
VTVVGVATSFTGAFFPNDNGFAIQEKKVGIYILDSLDANIEVGQVVRVTGTLTNSFGQVLSVAPTSIEVLGDAHEPRPHPVKTGEETEGRLVRIKGTIVSDIEDDLPFAVVVPTRLGIAVEVGQDEGPFKVGSARGRGRSQRRGDRRPSRAPPSSRCSDR